MSEADSHQGPRTSTRSGPLDPSCWISRTVSSLVGRDAIVAAQNSTVGAVSTRTSPVTPAAVAPPQSTLVAKRRLTASLRASGSVLRDSAKRSRAARARKPNTMAAPPNATPGPTLTQPQVFWEIPESTAGAGTVTGLVASGGADGAVVSGSAYSSFTS